MSATSRGEDYVDRRSEKAELKRRAREAAAEQDKVMSPGRPPGRAGAPGHVR